MATRPVKESVRPNDSSARNKTTVDTPKKKEIRDKIYQDTSEVLSRPDVRKALEDRSFVVDNLGPDAFVKMIADETAKWGPVIRAANIKGD